MGRGIKGRRAKTRRCVFCGELFKGIFRPEKKYCSDKCRRRVARLAMAQRAKEAKQGFVDVTALPPPPPKKHKIIIDSPPGFVEPVVEAEEYKPGVPLIDLDSLEIK